MEGDFERASFYTLSRGCKARMQNLGEEPSHRGAADDGVEKHLVLTGKERGMFLYSIALFIHVMAAMAMFTVIGIVLVSVVGMRRAQTVEQRI